METLQIKKSGKEKLVKYGDGEELNQIFLVQNANGSAKVLRTICGKTTWFDCLNLKGKQIIIGNLIQRFPTLEEAAIHAIKVLSNPDDFKKSGWCRF